MKIKKKKINYYVIKSLNKKRKKYKLRKNR